jgi:tRNA A-37 threonylcarbamoyl transferase component Bud32
VVNGAPEDLGDFAFTVMREMGAAIGHMHDSDVVHGDLTTSNIMIRRRAASASRSVTVAGSGSEDTTEEGHLKEQESAQQEQCLAEVRPFSPAEDDFQVVLIDFGLGMTQPSIEDRAVDLYVLERAFLSTHPGSEKLVCAHHSHTHIAWLIFIIIIAVTRVPTYTHSTSCVYISLFLLTPRSMNLCYQVAAALDAYRFGNCKAGAAVLSRLEQVRQRGRKRDMCG